MAYHGGEATARPFRLDRSEMNLRQRTKESVGARQKD
jgi:hypothetical protein